MFIYSHLFLSVFSLLQLQMLGYDVSWAAFNIVEVMSSSKFTYKVQFEYKSLKCRSQNVLPDHFLDETGNRLYFILL